MSTARVIEDDGGDMIKDVFEEKSLNDADKLARLEKNLQRAEEMKNVGLDTEDNDDTDTGERKAKRQKIASKKADAGPVDISYAPSFDEVTTDKDHLATLRGEGRYFGVVDPDVSQPVCSNCHRRGHRRAQCKVVVCHACGKVDDHYESQCPNSIVCSNCGEKGHFRNNCPEKRNQTFCVECDSRDHTTERCPTIWRSYVLKKKSKNAKTAYPTNKIFCYNCADKGHFGDECHLFRVSKTPNINGSAFSGDNLPKELVTQYKNIQQSNSGSRKRSYETSNNTNYNYAPPNYSNFNRGDNSNNKTPSGPSKQGYFRMNNNPSQNQRRNNGGFDNGYRGNNNGNSGYRGNNNNSGNYRGGDYPRNGQNNFNNSNSRTSYFNNNPNNNSNYRNPNSRRY